MIIDIMFVFFMGSGEYNNTNDVGTRSDSKGVLDKIGFGNGVPGEAVALIFKLRVHFRQGDIRE